MKTWYEALLYFKGNLHTGSIFCVPIANDRKYDTYECRRCLSLPFKVKLLLLDAKTKKILWLRNKKEVVHFE